MKSVLQITCCFIITFCLATCSNISPDKLTEPGVSMELATFRKSNYERIKYNLFFSIPEVKTEPVAGEAEITLVLKRKQPAIIDFRVHPNQILNVKVNGKTVDYEFINEHIVLSNNVLSLGENRISIIFTPDDQSLNRRDEFLYTLLVPDRARTLFPCFDQPDLKSLFTLSLEVPEKWQAVANGAIEKVDSVSKSDRKTVIFKQTEPLSTYLFSFVAGILEGIPFERNKREISVYHRETDPKKILQCQEIANEVFDALEWLEDYTAVSYPFTKYDLIILPGFQYGGMEHTGATLYNDRRMFLNEQPTLNERLSRSSLIAHETAHMWFGDYVTMEWFDDVWTKEVFANYFASKITEPLFPEVNHKLNFMLDYFPSSYAVDRTAGANPIKQQLDNLNNAGLVYGNIIYDKSPIILNMLINRMGETSFQSGIREYLKTYAYGNATWEGLVNILNKYSENDLKEWSRIWVNEKGMPVIETELKDNSVIYHQSDPWNRGINWAQEIASSIISDVAIPNTDGTAYGFFKLNDEQSRICFTLLDTCKDEILRGSLLITLYENMLNKIIPAETYMKAMLDYLSEETNSLLFSLTLGYISNCQRLYPTDISQIENVLWKIITTNNIPQHRLQAFRQFRSLAESTEALKRLYTIWKDEKAPDQCALSETDYIQLSYILAIRMPQSADEITKEQLSRITNPDRKTEYQFISPSVSPRKEERDSVFASLLIAENRRIEPWAATALSNLNHPARQEESVQYIRPALDVLQEVQRTGDIFFPTSWVRSLLKGHASDEAKNEVDRFFSDNPDYPLMLSNKIKQQFINN